LTLLSAAGKSAIRVLIVDDDGVLVRSLQRVLSIKGFEVDAALDGRAALQRLASKDYDVMLLDLRMGSMDGMEVFTTASSERRLPATIIHSAHIDVKTAVMATRAGVHDVMQKPVPEDVLALRIRELAGEHRGTRQRRLSDPPTADNLGALARLVGGSAKAKELREQTQRVAQFRDVPVLIQGPTGTGKELVAQAIHALTCPHEPFVSVNCAAVPEQLFESELFGHEAGAFTSARTPRVGLFEEAAGGTLFLDEVGEMPLALQAKLLRVLEIRQFRRVGGTHTRVFAARVVSATNRVLTSTSAGSLRPDLFFRLAGYAIRTPALTERLEDVPELSRHFLSDFAKRHNVNGAAFAREALDALIAYGWPGNIRELRAVVENAAIVAERGLILERDIQAALQARREASASEPSPSGTLPIAAAVAADAIPPTQVSGTRPALKSSSRSGSLPDLQRDMILQAFENSQRNLSKAALDLGIPRSTLRARLRRYGAR
jgi:DNA-binding NtrC family response regulator